MKLPDAVKSYINSLPSEGRQRVADATIWVRSQYFYKDNPSCLVAHGEGWRDMDDMAKLFRLQSGLDEASYDSDDFMRALGDSDYSADGTSKGEIEGSALIKNYARQQIIDESITTED